MSFSNEALIRSLLGEWLEELLDEVDVAHMFEKGHVSPVKRAKYDEPSPVTCQHFCGGPSMCEVCQIPDIDVRMITFKKGKVSSMKDAVLEPSSQVKSGGFYRFPITCQACDLPLTEERIDVQFERKNISSSRVSQPCCCQRSCRFKRLLFNGIGEALIYQDKYIRKTVKDLMHVKADLILALREVDDRLSQLENKTAD